MKSIYRGWLIVLAAALIGLLIVALGPRLRSADPGQDDIDREARTAYASESTDERAGEPARGRVTDNLSRARRLHLPVVAFFGWPPPAQPGENDNATTEQRQMAAANLQVHRLQLAVLGALAKANNGKLSVVMLHPGIASAEFLRSKITMVPTTVVYDANHREIWRGTGEVKLAEVNKQLQKIGLKSATSAVSLPQP